MMSSRRDYLLAGVLWVVLGLLLLWPVLSVVEAGFRDMRGYTLVYVKSIFTDADYRTGLINSLLVGVASTGLAVLMGTGLALLSTRYAFRGKGLLNGLAGQILALPGVEAVFYDVSNNPPATFGWE